MSVFRPFEGNRYGIGTLPLPVMEQTEGGPQLRLTERTGLKPLHTVSRTPYGDAACAPCADRLSLQSAVAARPEAVGNFVTQISVIDLMK
jgi:hypothetical protein